MPPARPRRFLTTPRPSPLLPSPPPANPPLGGRVGQLVGETRRARGGGSPWESGGGAGRLSVRPSEPRGVGCARPDLGGTCRSLVDELRWRPGLGRAVGGAATRRGLHGARARDSGLTAFESLAPPKALPRISTADTREGSFYLFAFSPPQGCCWGPVQRYVLPVPNRAAIFPLFHVYVLFR